MYARPAIISHDRVAATTLAANVGDSEETSRLVDTKISSQDSDSDAM